MHMVDKSDKFKKTVLNPGKSLKKYFYTVQKITIKLAGAIFKCKWNEFLVKAILYKYVENRELFSEK